MQLNKLPNFEFVNEIERIIICLVTINKTGGDLALIVIFVFFTRKYASHNVNINTHLTSVKTNLKKKSKHLS